MEIDARVVCRKRYAYTAFGYDVCQMYALMQVLATFFILSSHECSPNPRQNIQFGKLFCGNCYIRNVSRRALSYPNGRVGGVPQTLRIHCFWLRHVPNVCAIACSGNTLHYVVAGMLPKLSPEHTFLHACCPTRSIRNVWCS